MRQKERVLVTGSAGRIGRAVVRELLARGHVVRGFDRVASPGLEDGAVASILDASAVSAAMQGVTTLVHLAATPDDTDDFEGELVPNNITGVHRVLEAARAAGVQRLILASSGQVNDTQQCHGPLPIHATDPVTPRYWYAATKMFLESIGYSFAKRHGLSVIVARLGWCPRDELQVREIAAAERFQDVYLSPGDAGRFFACAVEAAATVRWAIVYAASRPVKQPRFDLETTRRLLGFVPQEQWPAGVEVVLGRPL
jgi:nucleoside-diphosphate-sugar epimerase